MQYTIIASVCVYFVTGWRAGAGGSLLMRSQIGFKEVYGAAPKTSLQFLWLLAGFHGRP